jgi:LPXTG-motif cell wall-anchored protein
MSVEPPATGTNSSSPLAAAISLLSIGALLVALARRRRRTI